MAAVSSIRPATRELSEHLADPTCLPTNEEVDEVLQSIQDPDEARQIFGTHEIPTMESVAEWGSYLVERFTSGNYGEPPIKILEVGAGRGDLSHALQAKLNDLADDTFTVIAVDTNPPENALDVLSVSGEEALAKYMPQVVIFSWMPLGVDCTAAFRKCASVQEYLLIGVSGPIGNEGLAMTGDKWKTWGNTEDFEWEMPQEDVAALIPPYIEDGFTRQDMDERFMPVQRNVYSTSVLNRPSTTVSFRRNTQ